VIRTLLLAAFVLSLPVGLGLAQDATTNVGGFLIRVTDETAPVLQSTTIAENGVTITRVFNESVVYSTGFTIDPSGGAATESYTSGSGTATIISTASRTILDSETATTDYTAGDCADLSANALATITNAAVTNNSTQIAEGGGAGVPLLARTTTKIIEAGDPIDFTPTVLSGENLTFEIEGEPASSTFDDETGQLTKASVAHGTYHVKITASNTVEGLPYSHDLYFVIVAYDDLVEVDQAWADESSVESYGLLNSPYTVYRFTEDITFPGMGFYVVQPNVTLDLNGFELHYGGNNVTGGRGVNLYLSWANTEISPPFPGSSEAFNCVVVNGEIINDGTGDKTHGVGGFRANGIVVENMRITTDGKDSYSAFFNWGGTGGSWFLNNIFTANTTSTFDRHAGPANIVGAANVLAVGNLMIGGNSGFNIGANSVISENIVSQNSFATNGYSAFTYRTNNITITDNLFLPTNGRGILFNAGEDHVATDNVILHYDEPNDEYGAVLNAAAVRSRYDTINLTYSRNTSLGIGGGPRQGASTLYISSGGDGVSTFSDNDGTVILADSPSAVDYVQAVTLEGTGSVDIGATGPGLDVISNNTFRSNHYMLRVSGPDAYCIQDEPLTNNSWAKVDGDTAYADFFAAVDDKMNAISLTTAVRTAAEAQIAVIDTIVASEITGAPDEITGTSYDSVFWFTLDNSNGDGYTMLCDVIDSTYGAGIDATTYRYVTLYASAINVREGETSTIQILDGATPVADTAVTVTSDEGDVDAYTTDASGNVTITFYNFALTKANPTDSPIVETPRVTSSVAVFGYAIPATVTHATPPATIDIGALNP